MLETQDRHHHQFADWPMVLFPIVQNRPLLLDGKPRRIIRRAPATVVDSLCARKKDYPPTCIPAAPTPIDILCVNEEILVQQAHVFKRIFPHHPKTTHKDVDIQFSIMGEEEHMLPTEETVPLEDLR